MSSADHFRFRARFTQKCFLNVEYCEHTRHQRGKVSHLRGLIYLCTILNSYGRYRMETHFYVLGALEKWHLSPMSTIGTR
jgi:hypothetical protein